MNSQLSNGDGARRISEKGWVVIPKELREKYGLVKGTRVRFVDYGGVMAIVPIAGDAAKTGSGMLRGRATRHRRPRIQRAI